MLITPSKISQDSNIAQSTQNSTVGGGDSLRTDEVEIDSKPSEFKKPVARVLFADEKLTGLKQQSSHKSSDLKSTATSFQVRRQPAPAGDYPDGLRKRLAENLIKYLHVGSRDSLNFLNSIFDFHRLDKTLLNNYLGDKSTVNFRALESQIKDLAPSGAAATSAS